MKKQYVFAALFCILASLTRIQGVLLLFPFLAIAFRGGHLFSKEITLQYFLSFLRVRWKVLLLSFSPLIGFFLYVSYLQLVYGDALLFYHAQEAFGANRSASKIILLPQVFYRYIVILFTFNTNITYFVTLVEMIMFSMVFGVLLIDFYKKVKEKNYSLELGILLFSTANILMPTFTGTFSSIPRYGLISLWFFVILAKVSKSSVRLGVLSIFIILHVILLGFFARGYFVS